MLKRKRIPTHKGAPWAWLVSHDLACFMPYTVLIRCYALHSFVPMHIDRCKPSQNETLRYSARPFRSGFPHASL